MSVTSIPTGTSIGHVHLKVADLDRSVRFYHELMGFDLIMRYGEQAAFLSAGGYHHHLGTNTWSPGAPATEDQARLLSWDLVVPTPADTADAARSLERAGYAVTAQDGAWRALNASAIAAARSAIPGDCLPCIVLLTDGNETAGDALTAARDAGVQYVQRHQAVVAEDLGPLSRAARHPADTRRPCSRTKAASGSCSRAWSARPRML